MIINDFISMKKNTTLNEARTIDLGSDSVAYQYGGKYYIKKGTEKREISSDQYNKLLKKNTNKSTTKSSNSKKIQKDFIDKYEDQAMTWDEFTDYAQDDEWGQMEVDEFSKHCKKSGIDPNKSLMFDPEGFEPDDSENYDHGSYGFFDDFLSKASNKKEINLSKDFKKSTDDESAYSNSTLYTFDDGSKVLEVSVGGGYESGVPVFFFQK